MGQIKTYLESNGIKTIRGNTEWNRSAIKGMLTNEKYVGDVMFQKTYRENPISKRTKINRGELDRYLVTDNHPAIIDRETFRLVKKELVKRSSKARSSKNAITELGKYSGKYALSELLFCDVCGGPFRRRSWSRKGVKKVYWRCLNHSEGGNNRCAQAKGIEEHILHDAICRALTNAIPSAGDVRSIVGSMLIYATSKNEILLECQSVEATIRELSSKADDAAVMCVRTEGNRELYEEEIEKYFASISKLRERLDELKQLLEASEEYQAEMKQITSWLENYDVSFSKYNDEIVRYLVEKIFVTKDLRLIIRIKGGGEIEEKIFLEEE